MKTYSIQTSFGETSIHEIGIGKPLVVFHGGPGLDSSYLLYSLSSLARWRRLIFFDQLGCSIRYSSDQTIDLTKTLKHVDETLAMLELGSDFGFLGHSWGTHLIFEHLRNSPASNPSEILLCNPFPLTWDRLLALGNRMGATLDQLLSPENKREKDRLGAIGTADVGVEYMRLIAPLYVANPQDASKLNFGFYNARIEGSVGASIQNFDTRSVTNHLPQKTLLILGEMDFIKPTDVAELIKTIKRVETIPGVGHSPFIEASDKFQSIVGEFLCKDSHA